MSGAIDVSVIVPAWKAAGFIDRAIGSALASTGVSIEVIAVDDGSPDNTFEVLQRLAAADPRVIAERLSANSGPSEARNRAIEVSKGRYLAILDADDAMAPGRLASLVTLAEESGADIVVDNMVEIDQADRRIGDKPFLKSTAFARPRSIDLATWVEFNRPMKPGDCLGYLKPLFRRSALEKTGTRYDPALRNSEDYYLAAHLLAAGAHMTYTPEAGYFYRRSSASTSHRLQPSQTRAWLDAEARFLARFANSFKPEERSALARRQRGLREVHQFVLALGAVKSKNIPAVLGLLASDIRASAFTLSTFAKIAMGKALRRKLV